MKEYSTNKRYCPHLLTTKVHSVEVYRQTKDVAYVCRRYHISKASLMRWNKKYDGTAESLKDKFHKPHSPHPKAHTEQELKWIRDYHKRMPNISICELYGKLRENKAYTRHPGSLYRVLIRLGFRKAVQSTKKKAAHTGLTSIRYNGTMAQWEAVYKGSGWNSNTGSYKVFCTDGTLFKWS